MNAQLDTPVLVLAFNRPTLLRALIDQLRLVRPSSLFLAVDGSRRDRPREAAAVEACRRIVGSIDWPCELNTRFPEDNLGCGLAVSSAISWFLDSVESGIVLEDDILPDCTFFPFCTTLLERYAGDDRVLAISGCSLVPSSGLDSPDLPYRFSSVPNVWGWALWRRTWQHYEFDITHWRSMISTRTIWESTGGSASGTLLWGAWFDMVATGQIDTWDVQLVLAAMRIRRLVATSNRQLTANHGFGSDATHQVHPPTLMPPVEPMAFPMVDVPIVADLSADAWIRRHQLLAAQRVPQILQRSSPGFASFIEEVRELQREKDG